MVSDGNHGLKSDLTMIYISMVSDGNHDQKSGKPLCKTHLTVVKPWWALVTMVKHIQLLFHWQGKCLHAGNRHFCQSRWNEQCGSNSQLDVYRLYIKTVYENMSFMSLSIERYIPWSTSHITLFSLIVNFSSNFSSLSRNISLVISV